MKRINYFLFYIAILFMSLNAWSAEGQDRGGGDPVAAEFLETITKVNIFMLSHPEIAVNANRSLMSESVKKISDSLNILGRASLVEVIETRPVDPSGVQKAAIFSGSPLKVVVHRQSWIESGSADKVVLAGMELLGIGGLNKNRYTVAKNLLGLRANEILALSTKNLVFEKGEKPTAKRRQIFEMKPLASNAEDGSTVGFEITYRKEKQQCLKEIWHGSSANSEYHELNLKYCAGFIEAEKIKSALGRNCYRNSITLNASQSEERVLSIDENCVCALDIDFGGDNRKGYTEKFSECEKRLEY